MKARIAPYVFAACVLVALYAIHRVIQAPPPDPVIHRLIQPNPPIDPNFMYPKSPVYEVRLLKLHLVRPDLIPYPLDTRYYA